MQTSALPIKEMNTRQEAADAVADLIVDALSSELALKGEARFFSSGGSTPKDTLEALSAIPLAWERVHVGLVDERCVPGDHPASNAGLVRRHLLKGTAQNAQFHPMVETDASAKTLGERANTLYAGLMPPSCILLGMGNDGHTASWFPGAINLNDALEAGERSVVGIDATGCPIAGEVTDRLSLTRSAIASSDQAVLLIFGDEKRNVLLNSLSLPIPKAPIRAAIEDLGQRLTIVWAP